MGCWGPGLWENDDALDLLGEVTEDGNFDAVIGAIELVATAAPDEFVHNWNHWKALAAAEIVACAFGARTEDSPEVVCAWLDEHRPAVGEDVLLLARLAVARAITDAPRRRGGWSRPTSAGTWLREIQRLDRTLAEIMVT